MQLKFSIQIVLLSLACGLMASCTVTSKPLGVTAQKVAPPGRVVFLPDDFQQYATETRVNLLNEKFTLLDATASRIRAGKERLTNGPWKLNAFYTGVGEPFTGDGDDESRWQTYLDKLRKWGSQVPDSITARVALANALVNYAWAARGTGFASTVSEEGWQKFHARSALAEAALDDAQKLPAKCPHWYVVKIRSGLGQRWPLARFEKLFQEGIALEPSYYYLYIIKATYLMPQWYGNIGDWEKFAAETFERVGHKEGPVLYYLISNQIRSSYGETFFTDTNVSWPRMKEGFINLEEAYGVSTKRLNETCKLALLAGDREMARGLFDRIGEDFDFLVWGTRAKFDIARAEARGAKQ